MNTRPGRQTGAISKRFWRGDDAGLPLRTTRQVPPAPVRFVAGWALFFFCLTLLFYYPGSLSWDPTVQWYEARLAVVTSQHPPFMSFVWHWLDLVIQGPGLFLALELAVFWLATGLLFVHLQAPKRLVIVGDVFLAANPFLMAHSALVIKDVIGGNLALAAFAVLIGYPRYKIRSIAIALSFALLALAGLMRYQLWVLTVPALASIFVFDAAAGKPAKSERVRQTAIALVALLVPIVAAEPAMRATFDLRPSYLDVGLRQAMIYDIAAVLAKSPDVSLSTFSDLGIDVEALRARAAAEYTPYSVASLMKPGGVIDMMEPVSGPNIRKQWTDLIAQVPGDLLVHRVTAFLHLLGIGDVYACWPLDTVGFLGRPVDKWQALNGASLKEAYATHLLGAPLFPAGTFLFRPITYLVLSVGLFTFWLCKKDTSAIFSCGMIAGAWIYWLTFAPMPLSCDVRYSYFPCAATLFAGLAWVVMMLTGERPAVAR